MYPFQTTQWPMEPRPIIHMLVLYSLFVHSFEFIWSVLFLFQGSFVIKVNGPEGWSWNPDKVRQFTVLAHNFSCSRFPYPPLPSVLFSPKINFMFNQAKEIAICRWQSLLMILVATVTKTLIFDSLGSFWFFSC